MTWDRRDWIIVFVTVAITVVVMEVLTPKPKPAPTTLVTCQSSNVLTGLSWTVDTSKDLGTQGCERNPNFPHSLLCSHPDLVAECKLP